MMVATDWQSARRIGVYGSWRPVGLTRNAIRWSYELGGLIAHHGILVTGGSGGVVLSCRQGCRDAGGMNLAVLPDAHVSDTIREENIVDIAIPTGLGVLGRMPSLTEVADYAIAIGGGAGTFVEIALTYLQRKIIVVVETMRRRGDPEISRILTRRHTKKVGNVTVLAGYLDSKPPELVRPIHVLRNVSPAAALNVATALYESIGRQALATSEVADR